jgi:hypothetical protein
MTLLSDYKEQQKLARARVQPHLWFTPFSVLHTLDHVRSEYFADLLATVHLYFVNRGPLACVVDEDSLVTIYVHQVLNHSDTPVEVASLICKHELLHIRIPPVVEGKKTIQHPPEFWKAEKAITPERTLAWLWIWNNLSSCLKKRPRLERIDVLPNWRDLWSRPMLDLATCRRLLRELSKETEEVVW